MSYILFRCDTHAALSVICQQCEPKTLVAVQTYLQNVLSKSTSYITSSHIQALNSEGVSVSLYYRCIQDDPESYLVCFLGDGNTLLSPFYHELDKFTETLGEHLSAPETLLDRWYFSCIEYVLRVVDHFKADLSSLLYVALSRNSVEIYASNPSCQIVKDTHLFVSACSLKELMYNTEVVFLPSKEPTETVMIDFENKIVNYETNTFCRKWAASIESELDAFALRQRLEDYKITANEDMNTFRRLLHLAEADHYAFYQGYEFVKTHDNGKILYEMLVHESTVYSLVTLDNLLGILQEFRLYREGAATALAAD